MPRRSLDFALAGPALAAGLAVWLAAAPFGAGGAACPVVVSARSLVEVPSRHGSLTSDIAASCSAGSAALAGRWCGS